MTLSELYSIYEESKGVSTDTRNISKGMIFFALKGPNHDGNEYAREALEKGANLVVCSKSPYSRKSKKVFVSKDPLKVLQKLANYHRGKLENTQVLGITGSNGKTTTRSLIAHLLRQRYRITETLKNFNNHIGLPLTILTADKNTQMMVLEMGANKEGDVKELCDIAEPDYGLITNIGKAHLKGFGSLEGVKRAKSELYVYLNDHGKVAFVDGKEDYLLELSVKIYEKIFYNQQFGKEYSSLKSHFTNITDEDGLEFIIHGKEKEAKIKMDLHGLYNIKNIVTAVTVAEYFNVEEDSIIKGLKSFEAFDNRSQKLKVAGLDVILDAYNANPTSMKLAIESFDAQKGKKKLAIIGEMSELGLVSEEEHKAVVEHLKSVKNTDVWLVGKNFSSMTLPKNFKLYEDVENVSTTDLKKIPKGTRVLLKGSRSVRLENIKEKLLSLE